MSVCEWCRGGSGAGVCVCGGGGLLRHHGINLAFGIHGEPHVAVPLSFAVPCTLTIDQGWSLENKSK